MASRINMGLQANRDDQVLGGSMILNGVRPPRPGRTALAGELILEGIRPAGPSRTPLGAGQIVGGNVPVSATPATPTPPPGSNAGPGIRALLQRTPSLFDLLSTSSNSQRRRRTTSPLPPPIVGGGAGGGGSGGGGATPAQVRR